jgi:hypothetical protein
MERFGTAPAPGRLARIQALVNTALTRRAGEPRHDLLATVTAAQGWLDGLLAGVDAEPVTLTEADLLVLRDLREGIRVALRASALNIAEAADQASLVRGGSRRALHLQLRDGQLPAGRVRCRRGDRDDRRGLACRPGNRTSEPAQDLRLAGLRGLLLRRLAQPGPRLARHEEVRHAQPLPGLTQSRPAGRDDRQSVKAAAEFGPHLPVAQLREQHCGEQQIHHDPGREQPHTGLGSPGRGQDLIDHLERNEAGQLAQMPRREHPRGYRHRPGYGNLISQRSSRFKGVLE